MTHPLRQRRDVTSYIDDAMYEGAYVPESQPRRCVRHIGHEANVQLAFDGLRDHVCMRCGFIVYTEGGGQ